VILTPEDVKLATQALNAQYQKLSTEASEFLGEQSGVPSLLVDFVQGLYMDRMAAVSQLTIKLNTPDTPVTPVGVPSAGVGTPATAA
jgi:hypothetical protein